jgi:hypothetical protein
MVPGCIGLLGGLVGTVVVVGTVTVTVLVPVVGRGVVAGLVVVAGAWARRTRRDRETSVPPVPPYIYCHLYRHTVI